MKNVRTIVGRQNQITYHEDHQEQNFKVTLAETGWESMTGGRVKRIEKYIDCDNFMVTYGDGVADVDINKLVDFHKSHGKLATLTAVQPVSRYGILQVDGEGSVKKFIEKPLLDGVASAGYMILNRRIFDYLGGDDCVLEEEPLQRLAEDGQLMAYRHDGFFFAMDTYREYKYLNELWDNGEAPWKVWE
ncbi:MAG: glucose-1-phosphate cytidylyltransferase [Microcoleus sp. CSU_2_2]|nr:glucose-1-phosphate cytidylyltransferase [Microcoleus sp. SU_5_3]NJS10896.1 glucose-1-phosphate cytidylyltransferase [Microcoleus sp. CSU_2_2]